MVATEVRQGKARHDDPNPIPIPRDLPAGTKAVIVEPDEPELVGGERVRLDRPVILRSVIHPNLKLVGRVIYRPHPWDPTKRVMYRLPMMKFDNSYIKVEYEDELERLKVSKYWPTFYVEPTKPDGTPWDEKDPDAPYLQKYVDDRGRVMFATRNPKAFEAYERRRRN